MATQRLQGGRRLRLAVLFGGPSSERNISAGSMKPWVTWLALDPGVELTVLFVGRDLTFFRLPARYWFTNTCEDFEGQLGEEERLDPVARDALLRRQDLVIPLIHGRYGEDGAVQSELDGLGVPYLFGTPEALAASLDKEQTYVRLAAAGFETPWHRVLERGPEGATAIWEELTRLPRRSSSARAAVKPVHGGSSIGVSLVHSKPQFLPAVRAAFEEDDQVLVEEALAGTEFSVAVLEAEDGTPVALAPSEIQKRGKSFDTRSKYLHGEGAVLHTPFRQAAHRDAIRRAAARAFALFGLRDLARIDGFLETSGRLWITDINGIGGTAFSSFVFLQAAFAGLTHADLMGRLIRRGLTRAGRGDLARSMHIDTPSHRARGQVHVLLGGPTSERQVSRQSGTFAGLCLEAAGFDVAFLLMDRATRVAPIGRFAVLHHEVEQIAALVDGAERQALDLPFAQQIAAELGSSKREISLACGPWQDLEAAAGETPFVFLALHGGPGEDGTVQAALDSLGVPYNGSGPCASALCSDKWLTQAAVDAAAIAGIRTAPRRLVNRVQMAGWLRSGNRSHWNAKFRELAHELGAPAIVIKPRADGCSTGVKLIRNGGELHEFVESIVRVRPYHSPGPGSRPIKMPEVPPPEWMIEAALVEAEPVPLPQGDLHANNLRPWFEAKRFIELTVALLENADGTFRAAAPSMTVATGNELSLEEKFQQGTGSNLDLSLFLEPRQVDELRDRLARLAVHLGLEGYARVDAFYDRDRGDLHVIEVNTLPGLTEATVLYSQALGSFGLSPAEVLAGLVEQGRKRSQPEQKQHATG